MKRILLLFLLFIFNIIFIQAQNGLGLSTNLRDLPPYFFGFNGANTVRADSGWYAEPIKNALQYMLPGNMRYPAGTTANFWDWQTGWFFKNLPYNLKAPYDNGLLASPKACKISDYAKSVGGKGPQMVYNLNLLTSNLNYQMAGAAYASSLGLSLASLEFGNEYYNGFPKNPEHTLPFPSPKAYADTCKRWAGVMNTWFPGKRTCVVGVEDAGKDLDAADYVRKKQWLKGVLTNLDTTIDAVTLHLYTGTGMGDIAFAQCDSSNLKKFMTQPFKNAAALLDSVFLPIENAGKKMCITEYNLAGEHAMYGTWAHGLFVAAQTLTYLERPSFDLVDCHDMFGDALSSAYFQDNNGYANVGGGLNIVTATNELTALGTTLTLLSKTLERSSKSEKLKFNPILPPELRFSSGGAVYPLFYGFAFNQGSGTSGRKQIILLNLSSSNINLDLYGGVGSGYDQKLGGDNIAIDFEMLQANPLKYITGNSIDVTDLSIYENCDGSSYPQSGRPNRYTGTTTTGLITLRPYSITYLGGTYGSPVILVDRPIICGNNPQTAVVYGKPPLTLTCSNTFVNITQVPNTENIFKVIYTGTAAASVFLYATDGNGVSTNKQFLFKIRPVLSIGGARTQSVCNFPLTLTSSMTSLNSTNPSGWKYIWSGNEGQVAILKKDISVKQLEKELTYLVQGFDGTCWSQPDSVTVKRLGYADAGLDKNVCTSSSTTLASNAAPSPASYEWKNLTTNSTSPTLNYTFTTDATPSVTNYQFKVTEGTCIKTDVVQVTSSACCTGGTFVLNPGDSINKLLSYLLINNPTLLDTIYEQKEKIIVVKASADTIQFNGVILINKNIKIVSHPNLKFAENAKLVLDKDRYLILDSCTLDVCTPGKFADGIYANSCQTNLRINHCTIKRFKSALNGIYNASVTVGNSDFTDNIIGAGLKSYTLEYPFLKVPFGNDTIEGIYNNNFSAPGIVSSQNTRGITIAAVEKFIINNESSNLFKNLDIALYNKSSGMQIANTIIGETNALVDTAIYIISTASSIAGRYKVDIGSSLAPNFFNKNTNGLICNNTGVLNIHHNNFNAITKSCFYSINAQDSIKINNNIASLFDKFIVITDPANNLIPIEIKKDSIYTTTYDETIPAPAQILGFPPPPYHPIRTAITVTSTLSNNRPVNIKDNYIRCRTAIYASKMNAINCEYNLIELNRFSFSIYGAESYGIRLENCLAPKLYINTIRKYNSFVWSERLTGFNLNACANADMQCNKLEYLRRPLYVAGSSLNQKFYNDTINSSGGGLVFSNAAVSNFGGNSLGNGYAGNVFNNFATTTNRAEGTLSGPITYYYRSGNDLKYKPSPSSINVLSFNSFVTPQIRPACGAAPPKSGGDELAAIANQVEDVNDSILDSGLPFDFGAEFNFYAQQSLYNQIITDSIDFTENTSEAELVQEFVTNVSETAIGLENEVIQLLSEGDVEGAMAVAENLPDSSVFEQNIQYVTQVILQIASDTLYKINHSDSTQLTTLAYTHSLIGGPAVFTARNLLQLVVEEFLNGSTKSQKGEHQLVAAPLQIVFLTPNPATDKVAIVGFCENEITYKVELYNLQNQLVATRLSSCQSNFAIQTLSNGLYLYKIFNNTNLVGYGKIQVLR